MIVSDDGYIVTNNHVIEDARQIEVVLNDNRSYIADIIGTDPTTDLALLKIEEQNLARARAACRRCGACRWLQHYFDGEKRNAGSTA